MFLAAHIATSTSPIDFILELAYLSLNIPFYQFLAHDHFIVTRLGEYSLEQSLI